MFSTTNIDKYHAAKGIHKAWWWVLLSLVALFAIGIAWWRVGLRRNELEKTRNELSKLRLAKVAKEHELAKLHDRETLSVLISEHKELQHTIDLKQRELVGRVKAFEDEYRKVKALESWRDLEQYNKLRR
jgi:hypothetical protein